MAASSNALIHSLKLILMFAGVLFIAILLTPQIFNFNAAQLPAVWSSLRSWLRPPYLYFILNGIIITIAASSRIHHHYMHPPASGAEKFRHIQHAESYRSSDAEPNSPIISAPGPEISSGFSFSFGVVNLENSYGTAEVFAYDETTTFGAGEAEIVEHVADHEKETAVVEKLGNRDFGYIDGGSVEPEMEARRKSVRTKPSPLPLPAPLSRKETYEIVSSFSQSQIEKVSPPSRICQNRKPSTLISLDETAESVKQEKVENYITTPWKTPSSLPRTQPLARQETSEIVSSFFHSQISEPSPPTGIGHSRRLSRVTPQSTVTSPNETTSATPYLPLPPPPQVTPLTRQETSEIVASFFQTQMEKPSPSARFGRHRKTTRSTPEGGKALRVAKPKRGETLESAWKTITEGRHMPLTRHLKKSDTWENQEREAASSDPSTPAAMKKSGTVTGRTKRSAVSGAMKLKTDRSLSKEELNRRVEEFIKKVNDEMRLQRQKSMQHFMDMVHREAQ